jgi:WD40 repeat protein
VWLWDALSGERVHQLRGFGKTIEGLGFAPDGSLLAAGGREGRVRVWEVGSGHERAVLDWNSGKVNDLAFSPDGSTAAAGCSRGVVVWDVD